MIIELCQPTAAFRKRAMDVVTGFGARGIRVLAVARTPPTHVTAADKVARFSPLSFLSFRLTRLRPLFSRLLLFVSPGQGAAAQL